LHFLIEPGKTILLFDSFFDLQGLYHVEVPVRDKLIKHREHINRYGQDMPEIRNWKWSS